MLRDFDPPIIINVRDRLTSLRKLVEWLERAGHERIVLLDNASTYEPLVDYLRHTSHVWIRFAENRGKLALWSDAGQLCRDWFVYTDPDIVPIEECPLDAVALLRHALLDHPEHAKAALGLYLADVPADMPSLVWERRLLDPLPGDAWRGHVSSIGETQIFDSLSDTTFALYRPGADFTLEALRTGWPYQARHDCPSWYVDRDPTDEDRYYWEHAGASWHGSSSAAWLRERHGSA